MTRPAPLVPAYTWPTAPQNAAVTCASVLAPVARFVDGGGGAGEERVGGVVLGLRCAYCCARSLMIMSMMSGLREVDQLPARR